MQRAKRARRTAPPSHTRRRARSPVLDADRYESQNGRAGFFDQEQNGFAYEEHLDPPTIESPVYRPPAPAGSERRSRSLLPVLLLALVFGAGIGAGAFFIGQSTRPSQAEVARHLAAQAARDRTFYTGKMTAALAAQRAHLRDVMNQHVQNASNSAFASGQSQGYTTGQSQGYSSGQAAGLDQGQQQGLKAGRRQGTAAGLIQGYSRGFNDGTCYDPHTYAYVC